MILTALLCALLVDSSPQREYDSSHYQNMSGNPFDAVSKEGVKHLVGEIGNFLAGGNAYCFVGAGLSLAVPGMPTWDNLIDALGVHLEREAYGGKQGSIEAFRRARVERDLKQAGQVYRDSKIHYGRKQQLFTDLLIQGKTPSDLHVDLMRLAFNGILTTNYDHLLEDAFAFLRGRSLPAYLPADLNDPNFEFGDRFFIAKVHGDAGRWNSIVIGDEDYGKANWVPKAAKHVEGKTLIVLGISGRDYLINRFLLNLDPKTRVFVFMSEQTRKEYEASVRSINPSIPSHVVIYEVSHENLAAMIHQLANSRATPCLRDCTWGEMPPPQPGRLLFGNSADQLRSFVSSTDRTCCLHARPGFGLSSFIGQFLRDRSAAEDSILLRLEAKEFLPLEAYLLHILAELPESAHNEYDLERHSSTVEWTIDAEGKALAKALKSISSGVLIVFEHAERLPRDIWNLLDCVVRNTGSRLKLIFATSDRFRPPMDYDKDFHLESAAQESVRLICEHRNIASAHEIQSVCNINISADLNTIILASSILQQGSASVEELREEIRHCKHEDLCKRVVKPMQNNRTLLQVLKAAAIYRSPRDIEMLQAAADVPLQDVRHAVEALCKSGLLLPSHSRRERYGMSTTIRTNLLKVLRWESGEMAEFSRRAGKQFERVVGRMLEEGAYSNRALCSVLPILATSLYFFQQANDRHEYVKCIAETSEYLIHMYHLHVLENWIADGSLPPGGLGSEDEFLLESIRANLTRVESLPSSFREHVKLAREHLNRGGAGHFGVRFEKLQYKIDWFEGIAATMERDYPRAMRIFGRSRSYAKEPTTKEFWNPRLRIVQTFMSLGRLRCAASLADHLDRLIPQVPTKNKDLLFHNLSMLHRHRSTLANLRLIFLDRRQITDGAEEIKNQLISQAIQHAEDTYRYSEMLRQSPQRFGRPDETGLGVARFKGAQVLYTVGRFEEAASYCEQSIKLLSGYPSNRWWRMSALDFRAKALAMLNQFDEADITIREAENIWQASAREDQVRYCELQFTRGLILMRKNEFSAGIRYLENSVAFNTPNPCVKALHYRRLAAAYFELNRSGDGERASAAARAEQISW